MSNDQKQTIISLIAIVVLVVLLVSFKKPIEAFLRANHLLPEPEPLTELYFEDHTNLPTTFVPGEPLSMRFTLHNLEYKPMDYVATISANYRLLQGVIRTVDIHLPHDGTQTLVQDFTLIEATRTAVAVELNTGQKIQLWLEPQ